MIFFDTEGVGGTGPLVTIQYSTRIDLKYNPKECILHLIWENPIKMTMNVMEWLCSEEEGICGFNLVHDWFQINKWYNIFRQLTSEELNDGNPQHNLIPRIAVIESRGPRPEDVCLKPKRALDLMLIARAGKYQYLAKHKSIIVRKVPSCCLIPEDRENSFYSLLNSAIQLPPGLKIRWRRSSKKTGRQDVSDVIGDFYPSSAFDSGGNLKPGMATKKQTFASLKQLAALILEKPEIAEKTFEQEVCNGGRIPYKEEPDFKPWGGSWGSGLLFLCNQFKENSRAIEYAKSDVYYTFLLWQSLGNPSGGDDDSELACLVGASYWKGFAIAPKEQLEEEVEKYNKKIEEMESEGVNCNAPNSVLRYLHSFCSDMDRISIQDTKKITLEAIERGEEWEGHPIKEAVKKIQETRRALKRRQLLESLLKAKRFSFAMKIQGTLSSRMSGGAERELKSIGKAEKLNPQGIPREKLFRELFLLAFEDEKLEGGDFEAFEPSILDAICGDEQFRKDLQSGLKIHLFAGSEFYGIPPEDIDKTKGTSQDKYIRSKNAFLGWIYGATQRRVAQVLDLDELQVEAGYNKIARRYGKITNHRRLLRERFIPLRQERGQGTAIEWVNPSESITAIKLPWQNEGYKRLFTSEWAIIKGLFSLAEKPPKGWQDTKGSCRRTNRVQSIVGAIQSALYASIFALQEHVFRAAANHEIQCPGAQITKHLQRKIWDLQPPGVQEWVVRPFNSHDEVQVPCRYLDIMSVAPNVEPSMSCQAPTQVGPGGVVAGLITELQQTIPLLRITWQTGLKNWGEKA